MKIHRFLVFLFFLFTFSHEALADSPITSTSFATVYKEEKIIQNAIKANGLITPAIIDFLSKKENSIELKMAVVNQLGWQEKIKDNAVLFYRSLGLKNRYKSEEEFLEKSSGDELLVYAYLRAMDDYQDVTPAIKFAEAALKKNPQSLTYNLIFSLIKAQKAMDGNWCDVYQIVNSVQQNKELNPDMKEEAVQIIYKYLNGYKEFCN